MRPCWGTLGASGEALLLVGSWPVGQAALQLLELLVRELLRPAGLLDVAVGRLPLLAEHGELAGQGPAGSR